jgi:hypothetical protein
MSFIAVILALIALVFLLLWPVPMMPKAIGAVVLAIRGWLRRYWDSQGG